MYAVLQTSEAGSAGAVSRRAVSTGYALCTLALCASLVWRELPASVDYPQHLAMARQLRDVLLGAGDGQLVPWTYNGLFEISAGVLALVLPIDLCGRMVLASSLALTSFAVWALVRFCGRPPVHAFAWLPLAYSFPLSWGFINFTLSVALATLSLIGWLEKRSVWTFLAMSLLTGVAHVLGAIVLAIGVLIGAVLRIRDVTAALQLIPLLAWVGGAHVAVNPPPHLPWASQTFFPTWSQRLHLADTLLGSWQGPADEWLAAAVALIVGIGLVMGAMSSSQHWRKMFREPFHWLALMAAVVYAVGPLAVFGCWFLFQRAGYLLTVWLPALLPSSALGRWELGRSVALVGAGALSTVNFLVHDGMGGELSQARAIIEAVPSAAKVASVLDLAPNETINEALRGAPGCDALVWAHFPAYAVALRGAETTWMFAREHGHFPVRLPVRQVQLPPVDYGWSRAFHPWADYAREFDHVLVLAGPQEPTRDPKATVFGASAVNAVELAHEGRFWLFKYTAEAP